MAKWHQQKGICTPQIPLFTYRTSFFYLHNSSLVHISLINSVAAIEFRFLWVADSCVCVVQLWGHSESIGKTATWQTSKNSDHKLPNNEFTWVRLSIFFYLVQLPCWFGWADDVITSLIDCNLIFNVSWCSGIQNIRFNIFKCYAGLACFAYMEFICCSLHKLLFLA